MAGTITSITPVNGTLYTVNPMAVREVVDVYTENKRVVMTIQSPVFGLVTCIIIGAMMVGSIHLTSSLNQEVKA